MFSFFWPRRFLTKLLGARSRPAAPCRKARYVDLALETLECREVPATFNWITTAAGTYNWSSPSNWQGGLAPVAANLNGDDIVNFAAALSGHVTVVVNGDYTIAQLNIGDPSGTQTYTLAAGGTGSGLNFAVDSLTASITKSNAGGGADLILAPINLTAGLTIADNTTNAFDFGGNVDLNDNALTVTGAGHTVISSVISGGGSVTTTGPGTLTLSNDDPFTGPTSVDGGYLQADGTLGSTSTVSVAAGATLGGNGLIGGTTIGGSLTPGGPAQLTAAGTLTFGPASYYDVALNGTAPGTGYDQVAITSSDGVNLSNYPALIVSSNFTPAAGAQFAIITEQGGGSVTGMFDGLPEGSVVTVGGQSFTITYLGGTSGHDIVLTALSTSSVTTVPPTSQAVTAGNAATFNAAITGPTSTVQWLVSADGGLTFTQISGATSTTLTINNVTSAENGCLYEAVFTNSIGVAITSPATLTVDTAPVVITQPADESVNAGGSATFTATASGNPAPTVQWQVSSNGGQTYTPISGATSTTLTLTSVSASQSDDLYEAVFTNSGGSVASNAATLTVDTLPVVTAAPTSQTIMAGGSATITAAGTGNPAPTVQWEVSVDGGVTFNPVAGAESTTLLLSGVPASSDGYEYEAVFSNAAGGVASTPATLTVQYAPVVTGQPSNQTVTGGNTVVFTAVASGEPAPTVQWELSTNSGLSFSPISGAISTTLTVIGVNSDYNGYEYEAVFTNSIGSTTSNPATLTFPSLTNILQYRDNDQSTGVNSTEYMLTPANVTLGSFGKLFTTTLDDQVFAQPLVDMGITIANGPNTLIGAAGVHSVVYVATESDEIYAIDTVTGAILWERSFLTVSNPDNNTLGASSIAPQDSVDAGSFDISPNIGITGTPVIDNSTNTLYVVVSTKESIEGNIYFVQRLHAINLSDGTDQVTPYLIGSTNNGNANNTPIYVYGTGDGAVTDPYNGTGMDVVQFNALRENQRAALSLVNGCVYVAWASHGDNGPYHGWIVKWNVSNLMTSGLVLAGVFCTSPDDGLAGIWNGGGQLTFEPDGSAIYFSTGNGSGGAPTINAAGFPSDANYNEAVVKITNDPTTTGGTNQNANGWGFKVVDWFIPYNVVALDNADDDLGSGAIVILPPSAGISGHPNLLIAGGKEGALYVLDRDGLGHFNPTSDAALNSVPNGNGDDTPAEVVNGLLSTPSYFDGNLYVMSGYNGAFYEFALSSSGMLNPVSQSADTDFGYNPGSPAISADGTNNGIVWVYDRQASELHAYAATSLGTEIWNSNDNPTDSLGAAIRFAVPVVANGEVFTATSDALVVYGLFALPTAVPDAPILAGTASGGLAVNLTWTDPTAIPNTATGYTIEESTDDIDFTPVATAVAGATTVSIGGLQPLTQYYFEITSYNKVGTSSSSNVVSVTTSYLTPAVDFSGGFAHAASQMAFNGSTQLKKPRLALTSLNNDEAGSAFYTTPVDVTGFTSEFTFQLSSGAGTGAGFTFTIQGVAPTAIGSNGAGLGYAGITRSVAIKFDLYNDNGEGVDSTGLFSGGANPTNTGSIDLTPSGVDLHSGDVMMVNMTYNGTTLAVTIIDTVTEQSATQDYTVNIPSLVGGNVAYVGFTAGAEGSPTFQDILTWTYAPDAAVSPYPPVGLGAVPATATSVQLTWTNPANNNQTGYTLVRATDLNFTQNVVKQNLPGTPSSFTDTANGLAPGNTYYYELQAYNSAGSSSFSNVVTVVIPDAPPTPTMQQMTGVSTTEIDLYWQDNAGHQATGYQILRSINFGAFSTIALLPPTSRTAPSGYEWSDTNLTPGTYYAYHIIAYNSSGNNDFAGLDATTLTVPPSNLTATAGDGLINLLWTAPSGALTYNIYRGTSPGGEGGAPLYTGVTTTSFADTEVTGGTTYYYAVTSVNLNCTYEPPLPAESDDSNEASAGSVDVVTTQPANQTVNAGQTATFTASTADTADAIQWQVNTGSGFAKLTDGGVYSGSATPTLTITGAVGAMSGDQYQAVFSNGAGILTSSAVTMTVDVPPAVTMQPVNQTVNAGQSATFTVAASGMPAPALQWLVSADNGVSWTNITGATSTTLTLNGVAATQSGDEYEAIFTNSAGTATTGSALLSVDYVTAQPANQTINAGKTAIFTAATADATDTVQWQVNTGSGFTNLTDGGVYSGSATPSLTIAGAVGAMSGDQYQAVFSNGAGILTSSAATMTVDVPPAVTMQSVNQTVNAGQSATFTVAASGMPAPALQWLVSADDGVSWTNITGATSTTLTLNGVAATQSGDEYEAIFTNIAGTATTGSALLSVDYVTAQPANQTINAGKTAIFTAATADATDTVQWQVNTGSGFTNLTDGGVYSGSATPSLTIAGAVGAMSGDQYQAVFSNGAGILTSSAATMTVDVPPAVTMQPVNQTVNAGQTATFTVAASGMPAPALQWLVSADDGVSWTNIAGATSTTLILTGVAAIQNGDEYEAVFTNSTGTAATGSALLSVDYVTAQPANQTINAGKTAIFTAATADATDTVQWQVNTGSGFTNLTDGGVYSGSATPSLTITGAMSGNQYQAVFMNSAGSLTTNTATLTVAPALVGLPVVNGSRAAINIVSAAGDGTTATITTDGAPHGFWVGELVTLTGVTPSGPGGLAGTVTVTGVPSATRFQFASTYLGSETLSGATVRAALAGAQRSMVDSIVYNFTEPVTLTAAAFSISVVENNTTTGSAVGMAPTLNVAAVPFTNEWVVTFTDPVKNSVIGHSIANGAYSISINSALVTAVSDGQNLSAGETDTFYRLYGDVTGGQSVTNVDANAFNRAWGNAYYSAAYNAALDYNDDGKYTNIDANAFNRAFNTRFNVATTV